MTKAEIISHLPYDKPFLFVDELMAISEDGAEGIFRFDESLPFYEGHFKNNPITPGVILTETMAQIGVVCLGIYLIMLEGKNPEDGAMAMTSTQINFYKPVFPNETVRVKSTKEYFRFKKLKCHVELFNEKDELACRGKISGMVNI